MLFERRNARERGSTNDRDGRSAPSRAFARRGAHDGVDASEAEGATRKLGMNIIAGSGSYGEWIYNCADMADLDPDELFG